MPIDNQINTPDAQTVLVAMETGKSAHSFTMLEQHLQQPSQKLQTGYDPIIGGIQPIYEQDLPLVHELSTATGFDGGEFRTIGNSYFIFREEDDPRITSFDGEETLLRFREASAFRTPEQTLSFLRSMEPSLIHNVDQKILTSHLNVLRIIAQATVELVLAISAEIRGGIDDDVEIYVSARSNLDRSVEIELGPLGQQPTGVYIPTGTLIIGNGFDDLITGPYVRIEERLRVPSLVIAPIYARSATLTFAHLGLHDLSRLRSEIDESFESY